MIKKIQEIEVIKKLRTDGWSPQKGTIPTLSTNDEDKNVGLDQQSKKKTITDNYQFISIAFDQYAPNHPKLNKKNEQLKNEKQKSYQLMHDFESIKEIENSHFDPDYKVVVNDCQSESIHEDENFKKETQQNNYMQLDNKSNQDFIFKDFYIQQDNFDIEKGPRYCKNGNIVKHSILGNEKEFQKYKGMQNSQLMSIQKSSTVKLSQQSSKLHLSQSSSKRQLSASKNTPTNQQRKESITEKKKKSQNDENYVRVTKKQLLKQMKVINRNKQQQEMENLNMNQMHKQNSNRRLMFVNRQQNYEYVKTEGNQQIGDKDNMDICLTNQNTFMSARPKTQQSNDVQMTLNSRRTAIQSRERQQSSTIEHQKILNNWSKQIVKLTNYSQRNKEQLLIYNQNSYRKKQEVKDLVDMVDSIDNQIEDNYWKGILRKQKIQNFKGRKNLIEYLKKLRMKESQSQNIFNYREGMFVQDTIQEKCLEIIRQTDLQVEQQDRSFEFKSPKNIQVPTFRKGSWNEQASKYKHDYIDRLVRDAFNLKNGQKLNEYQAGIKLKLIQNYDKVRAYRSNIDDKKLKELTLEGQNVFQKELNWLMNDGQNKNSEYKKLFDPDNQFDQEMRNRMKQKIKAKRID